MAEAKHEEDGIQAYRYQRVMNGESIYSRTIPQLAIDMSHALGLDTRWLLVNESEITFAQEAFPRPAPSQKGTFLYPEVMNEHGKIDWNKLHELKAIETPELRQERSQAAKNRIKREMAAAEKKSREEAEKITLPVQLVKDLLEIARATQDLQKRKVEIKPSLEAYLVIPPSDYVMQK